MYMYTHSHMCKYTYTQIWIHTCTYIDTYIYVPTKLRTAQQEQNQDQQGDRQEGGRQETPCQLQHTQDPDDTPQGTCSSVLHGALRRVAMRCSVLECVAVF